MPRTRTVVMLVVLAVVLICYTLAPLLGSDVQFDAVFANADKQIDLINGAPVPDHPTPLIFQDQHGQPRWTVSIPPSYGFPLNYAGGAETHLRGRPCERKQLGLTCLQNPETRETRLQALSAARKLVWELESEQGAVFNRIGDLLSTLALGFLVNIGVPQSIPQHGSIFLDELAVKVQADASFLARLMRLLCAFGIFQETDRDTYAHTKQSILYGQAEGEFVSLLINEQFLPVFPRLSEYFVDRTLESPNDPKRHPYGWAHGMNDHHWIEVLARDPKNLALFAKSAGFLGDFAADVYIYPYDKELKGASDKAVTDNSVLMVDIGGSTGDTMKILRQHYSDLKGRIVVQDIPD
ncbi:S-adenosyl-L-methionine-dependent methyltransferase, partial [Aureobasidium pullulans]